MKKRFIQKVTGRLILTAFLALLQIAVMIASVVIMSDSFVYFSIAVSFISIAVVIFIINKPSNPAYKLAWIILILSFPVFGGLFYIISKGQASTRDFVNREKRISDKVKKLYTSGDEALEEIGKQSGSVAYVSRYLNNVGFPLYTGSEAEYLSDGVKCFEAMKREIEKAESFIFIESFIIREDSFWGEIYYLLKAKAAAGVEVRIIYDGMGSGTTLSPDFPERMKNAGIKTMEFSPFRPVITVIQNNRDHRKILVVDGKCAITGGVNIGDEYIGRTERFGHWKDASLLVRGEAVRTFTLMFLQMWYMRNPVDAGVFKYIPEPEEIRAEKNEFVQPYGDSPLDGENTGERVYLGMIARATDSIYITTPYLIPDNELVTALCMAAKSGVDVRIITPHIPDKWYVHLVSRSFYRELIADGVKIYEYTPGFIHSKIMVADGKCAVVGSINLDYRSLYLHFECAAFISGSAALEQISADFGETLAKSEQITEEKMKLIKRRSGLLMSILKILAPIF